jgi:LPS export ABC transporter protein LptC
MMRGVLSWVGILAVLGFFAWLLEGATRPVEGPSRFADSGSHVRIAAPHMREIGDDGVRLIAQSREATFNQAENLVVADELHGFVIRDGRRTEIWSATGEYNMASTRATLAGGVKILNDDGYLFTTETAEYSHDTRLLKAAGPFNLDGNGLKLRGVGLEYDILGDRFRVLRDVGASIERFSF